jgi:hypothetical protein
MTCRHEWNLCPSHSCATFEFFRSELKSRASQKKLFESDFFAACQTVMFNSLITIIGVVVNWYRGSARLARIG